MTQQLSRAFRTQNSKSIANGYINILSLCCTNICCGGFRVIFFFPFVAFGTCASLFTIVKVIFMILPSVQYRRCCVCRCALPHCEYHNLCSVPTTQSTSAYVSCNSIAFSFVLCLVLPHPSASGCELQNSLFNLLKVSAQAHNFHFQKWARGSNASRDVCTRNNLGKFT